MFIAELSALDIGSYVTVTGVPKGNKYRDSFAGVITEIKHNTISGNTAVRLAHRQYLYNKEIQDRLVAEVAGYAKTWPFGTEVIVHDAPL